MSRADERVANYRRWQWKLKLFASASGMDWKFCLRGVLAGAISVLIYLNVIGIASPVSLTFHPRIVACKPTFA
jgi:hypothetical protein